jgi:iron complex outermembrane receptor protein
MYSFKMGRGLPNPNLQTERSQNYEIGYMRPFGGSTVAQLEFFRSDLRDAIESITAPAGVQALYPGACSNPNSCSVNENASQETHQGAEFALHSTPVSRATFDASYTYVNKAIAGFTFTGQPISGYPCGSGDFLAVGTGTPTRTTIPDNTCLIPTDLPKNKAVAAATLRLPHNSMLNSSIRYEGGNKAIESYEVGKTYYIEALPMSNFATWDVAGVLPEIYKGATMQVGIRNILDRNYYYVLQYPEEGRNWFINMRYRF